jgi:hypothetical protein
VSTFKSSSFNDTVKVEIRAEDGASELAVVNAAFNLVGRGIGKLDLELPQGAYQVRQSIGAATAVRDFEVPIEHPRSETVTVNLEPLVFATPAPIAGTRTFREVPADMWHKPDEMVGQPGMRIVLRAPFDESEGVAPSPPSVARVEAEIRRLRLETLAGKIIFNFADVVLPERFQTTALFVDDRALEPGHYVLVQARDGSDPDGGGEGRQRCLPLIVQREFSPRVYLLSLNDESRQRRLGLNLDNAGIIYWPCDQASSPEPAELRLVEAARKALSKGQGIGGYLAARRDAVNRDVLSPMLALMDAYLVLGSGQLDEAPAAIEVAAASLGEDFPDVVALRCAYQCYRRERGLEGAQEQGFNGMRLSGPPMLSQSWRHMLEMESLNEQLARVMPFAFKPELSGAWFTWNEAQGARSTALVQRPPDQGKTVLLQTAAAALVALMNERLVDEAISHLRERLAQQDSLLAEQRLDPLAVELIQGLCKMQDRFLLDAFGPQQVAEQVLTSLRIPSDRFPVLLATLEKLFAEYTSVGAIVKWGAKSLLKWVVHAFDPKRR